MKKKKVKYNKLICDKIPEKIRQRGSDYKVIKLSRKKFERELIKKIGDEAGGLLAAKTRKELISELADVIAATEELKRIKNISAKEISKALRLNFKLKGGFTKRLFLIWSSDDGYKTNERRYNKNSG